MKAGVTEQPALLEVRQLEPLPVLACKISRIALAFA